MASSVSVIQPIGVFDGTQSEAFRSEVEQALQAGSKRILVDMAEVSFMDSSGLGAMVIGLKAVRAAEGELFICAINDQIRMLFELTSMDQVFKIFPHRAAFEESLLALQAVSSQ